MKKINHFCKLFNINVNNENESLELHNKTISLNSLNDADSGLPILLLVIHHFHSALFEESKPNLIYADFMFDESSLFGIRVNFDDKSLLKSLKFNELVEVAAKVLNKQNWFKSCQSGEDIILAIQSRCHNFIEESVSDRLAFMNEYSESSTELPMPDNLLNTKLVSSYLLEKRSLESNSSLTKSYDLIAKRLNKKSTSGPLTSTEIKRYITTLLKHGDNDVQTLIKQLILVSTATYLDDYNVRITEVSNLKVPKVDDTMFLVALLGAPNVLRFFSDYFDCPLERVLFPEEVYTLRSKLDNSFEERTFEVTNNQSVNWFQRIEQLVSFPEISETTARILMALINTNSFPYTFCSSRIASFSEHHRKISLLKSKVAEFIVSNTESRADNFLFSKNTMKEELKWAVVGQESAKKSLLNSISFYNTSVAPTLFTFLGKSGVGKTSLAEAFAYTYEECFYTGHKTYVVNCENYADKDDASRLFGSGQQYVNSFLGELTSLVALYPRQILIFDEIEKAHTLVHRSLLTLLSKRKIRDFTTGRWVDFSQCLFIFTTNLGADKVDEINSSQHDFNLPSLLQGPQNGFNQNLHQQALPIEFINRLGSGCIAAFSSLDEWEVALLFISETYKLHYTNNWPEPCFDTEQCYQTVETLLDTYSGDFSPRSIVTHGDKLISEAYAFLSEQLNDIPSIKKITKLATDARKFKCAVISDDKTLIKKTDQLETNSLHEITLISLKRLANYKSIERYMAQYDLVIIDKQSFDVNEIYCVDAITELKQKMLHLDVLTLKSFSFEALTNYLIAYPVFLAVKKRGLRGQKSKYSFNFRQNAQGVDCEVINLSITSTLRPSLLELPFVTVANKTNVKLTDVVGMEVAKNTLTTAINALSQSDNNKCDARSKGALLYGPPGTGKTFLIQALANEINLPLITVNSSDITIGDSTNNINALFSELKSNAPCVVFFDEFDAIAQKRSNNNSVYNTILVNNLLTAINGFENTNKPVYVIGATNNPDAIDPAIKRPGRIDELIDCMPPKEKELIPYLKSLSEKYQISLNDKQFKSLKLSALGETVPAIEKAFFKANHNSLLDDLSIYKQVQFNLFNLSQDDIISANFTNDECNRVKAYHEAGHLVAFKLLMPDIEISSCSIISKGNSGGWTIAHYPTSKKRKISSASMFHEIQTLLAGRAAEKIMIGEPSFGAKQDIQMATKRLKEAYQSGCMFEADWLIDSTQFTVEHSSLAKQVNECLKQQYKKIYDLLLSHKALLTKVAEALLDKKILFNEDIEIVFLNRDIKMSPKIH